MMSALRQKQASALQKVMSALPAIADIRSATTNARYGQIADLWLFVIPAKLHGVVPNLSSAATAAQANLKKQGWRFCSMAKLVFGMNQSLDGYVDHEAFA